MDKSLDADDVTVVRPDGLMRPQHDKSRGPLDDNDSHDSGGHDSFTTHVDDRD
ncbi:MAG: hypothetical protein HOY79_51300 [Streptomyces sp.]|nr:hypothetical protein [Streptomyces sp.]